MNCDHVFDVLTRGPFPTGDESDDAVERHLVHCRQCRRLADALRPAIELFEEAVAPDESQGLPAYWGEVGWSDDSLWSNESREDKSNWLPDSSPPAVAVRTAGSNRLAGGLMFAVAVLVGIVLVGVVHYGLPSVPANFASGLEALEALGPAAPCLSIVTPVVRPSDTPVVAAVPNADGQDTMKLIQCCLECHAAEKPLRVGDAAMARIGRGCQICHLQFH